jgi:hypothetical protein
VSDPRSSPPGGSDGPDLVLTITMIIFGIILMLPGLCSIVFAGMMFTDFSGSELVPLLVIWIPCLLLGVVGAQFIVHAFPRR